jgi:hypothetical protein
MLGGVIPKFFREMGWLGRGMFLSGLNQNDFRQNQYRDRKKTRVAQKMVNILFSRCMRACLD